MICLISNALSFGTGFRCLTVPVSVLLLLPHSLMLLKSLQAAPLAVRSCYDSLKQTGSTSLLNSTQHAMKGVE